MGGGGSYYDRDTTDGYTKTARGYSADAEQLMSRSEADAGMLPTGRTITSTAQSPIVSTYDVTGSVDNLPMIITDKMPLIAGQIVQNCYLDDPEIALGAIGDPECDRASIQIGDFIKLRESDAMLKRIWRENGGGGNSVEGYEFMAYFLAKYCEMPNAVTPFCLFTADEGVRDKLDKGLLQKVFGGQHATVTTKKVFEELDAKFMGNVFMIHRYYRGGDAEAVASFTRAGFADERIIRLPSDTAISDLTLGLIAVMSGSRTLNEYLSDMTDKRDKAQTQERIDEVGAALLRVSALAPKTRPTAPAKGGKKKAADKSDAGGKKKKAGRL